MAQGKLRAVSSWIEDAKRDGEVEEDLLACRLIVLKIVRYMKDHHLSQKELAERLNVSPQYINKFLHGQDLDMKITTALRYGRILGIKLWDIPCQYNQEERYSSFGSIPVIGTPVQPITIDYADGFYDSIIPKVRMGVMGSSRPAS